MYVQHVYNVCLRGYMYIFQSSLIAWNDGMRYNLLFHFADEVTATDSRVLWSSHGQSKVPKI